MKRAAQVFAISASCWLAAACTPQQTRPTFVAGSDADRQCQALLAAPEIDPLRNLIPVEAIQIKQVPSAAMRTNTAKPDDKAREAVRMLEQAVRNCKEIHKAAGYVSYAMADIRDLRISDMRARLHRGEISYAAYNTRYLEILTEQADQNVRFAEAYERGRQAGNEAALAMSNQIQSDMDRERFYNELSNIRFEQSMAQYRRWNCSANTLGSTTYVSCY